MELIRIQCNSCGNIASDQADKAAACTRCGSETIQVQRCAWCSQMSAASDYCEHCGSVMATQTNYGASRLLKKRGVDQVAISLQLEKASDTELQQLEDEFNPHRKIAQQLVNIAKFCTQYLYNAQYHYEFEDRLIKDLPFDKPIFDLLSQENIPEESTVGAQLNVIANTCKLQELAEVANIACVKYPEAIIDSHSAKQWRDKVVAVALGEGINVMEALVALAHWRSWVAPFYFDIYDDEIGKKIYNTAYGKLYNSDGEKAQWLAVLCAKTEYFHKLKPKDRTRLSILKILREGLNSNNLDLRLSCAILLNDENVFADLVDSDNPEIKQVSLKVLSYCASDKLAGTIRKAVHNEITLILDGLGSALAEEGARLSPLICEAFCDILEKLEASLLNQVVTLVSEHSTGKEKYYKKLTQFLNRHDDKTLSMDILFDANKANPEQLQKTLLETPLTGEIIAKLEPIARKHFFNAEFSDVLLRYMRQCLLREDYSSQAQNFYDILVSQIKPTNPVAFSYKRFIIENLLHSNTILSNRVYNLLEQTLDALMSIKTQTDGDHLFFSAAFCEIYMGSVDNLMTALKQIMIQPDEYRCSAWLIQRMLVNQQTFKRLIINHLDAAKSILQGIFHKQAQGQVAGDLMQFVCAPIGENKIDFSPFFEVIEFDAIAPQTMTLLVEASEQYLFSKRLLIEALQYFELSQDAKYLEQIQTLLFRQCTKEPAFAYYCVSYLVRSSFSTDDVEKANNAFTILNYISSNGVSYLGPKDKLSYRLTDLGNFIRNFFNSLDDFTELLCQIVRHEKIFGIELWLLNSFHRNTKIVNARYFDKKQRLQNIIVSVISQTIERKYTKTSQAIVFEFIRDYLPNLPISDFIVNNTSELLADIKVGGDIPDTVFSQLRLVYREYEKSEATKVPATGANNSSAQFLDNITFGTQAVDIDFEVSLAWLRKVVTLFETQSPETLLATLAQFHNHVTDFRALLDDEAELRQSIVLGLIDIVLKDLARQGHENLSQRLLASELVYVLARNSTFAHYCIGVIKDRLQDLPADVQHTDYIKRILERLSEIRLDGTKASPLPKALKEPVKRRLPSYSQKEIQFDSQSLEAQFDNKQLRQRLLTGIGFIDSHDYIEAIDQFKSMLDLEVSDRIYYLIGKAYLLYDLPEQASKYIEKCLVLNPSNWEALILYAFQHEFVENNLVMAETLAKRAHALMPESDRVLVRIGSINLKRGKHTVAMQFIQDSLKRNPGNPEAYFLLGEVLQRTKRFKESIKYYQKTLSLGANDPCVYSAIGVSEFKLGNVVDGVKQLKQALAIDQGCAIAHYGLGEIYSSSGDINKAESHLKQACTIDSKNSLYRMRLAEHYQLQNDNEKALDLMVQIADEGDPKPSNLIQIARLCAENDRLAEGQDYLERAISLQPENFMLYFELAQMYEQTDALGNAIGILQRVVELKPDFVDAWLKMGDIYSTMARVEQAQQSFDKVLSMEKNNAKALIGLGTLYSHSGDKKKAEKYFKRAGRTKH